MLCVFILKSAKPARDASAGGQVARPLSMLYCVSREASMSSVRTGKYTNHQKRHCSPSLGQGGPITAGLSMPSVPWIHTGQGCHGVLVIFTPQDRRLWYGCLQERWTGWTHLTAQTPASVLGFLHVDAGVFQSITVKRGSYSWKRLAVWSRSSKSQRKSRSRAGLRVFGHWSLSCGRGRFQSAGGLFLKAQMRVCF